MTYTLSRYRDFLKNIRLTSRAFEASCSIKKALFGQIRLYATKEGLTRLVEKRESLLRVAHSIREVFFSVSPFLSSLDFTSFMKIYAEQNDVAQIMLDNNLRPFLPSVPLLGENFGLGRDVRSLFSAYSEFARSDDKAVQEDLCTIWTEVLTAFTKADMFVFEFWDENLPREFYDERQNLIVTLCGNSQGAQRLLRKAAITSNNMLVQKAIHCLKAAGKRSIRELYLDHEIIIRRDDQHMPSWEQLDLGKLSKFRSIPLMWYRTEDPDLNDAWNSYSAQNCVNDADKILPLIFGKAHNSLEDIWLEGDADDWTGDWDITPMADLVFPRLKRVFFEGILAPGPAMAKFLARCPELKYLGMIRCDFYTESQPQGQNYKAIFDAVRIHPNAIVLNFVGEYCATREDVSVSVDTGKAETFRRWRSKYFPITELEDHLCQYVCKQGDWTSVLEIRYPQDD